MFLRLICFEKNLAMAGVAWWIERQPVNLGGCQFDSQSGHMPGLQAKFLVGDA